jgi:hypothetical protein
VQAYAWALWLAAPLALTVLACLWTWWRRRPVREPTVQETMRRHADYLDALTHRAAGRARVEHRP